MGKMFMYEWRLKVVFSKYFYYLLVQNIDRGSLLEGDHF